MRDLRVGASPHAAKTATSCQKVCAGDRKPPWGGRPRSLSLLRLLQSKKINWGKNKSLYRIHFALSEILQMQARGKPERASLMIVQLLRAVHQVALDQGSWQAASLLLSHTDPMERQRFGGEPEQLERIASYLKAVSELEKRSLQNAPKEDNPNPNPKGRGKNDRKGGKKEDEADQ